ncbi:hypothetical protein STEG23_007438, partial [Scotinomys teguina]
MGSDVGTVKANLSLSFSCKEVELQLQSFLVAFITMTTLIIVHIKGEEEQPPGIIIVVMDLLQIGLRIGLYSPNSIHLHSQSPAPHHFLEVILHSDAKDERNLQSCRYMGG